MDADRNKLLKNFDERPHRRIVTPHGGEWICPTLIPSNTWFMSLTRVSPANGISIDSAVFVELTNVTNRHTYRQTHTPMTLLCVAIGRYR